MKRRTSWYLLGALLGTHAILLAWSALRHSPTLDEIGHLPAGVSPWQLGRFDLYRVNPPLVRMTAALPVAVAGPPFEWNVPSLSSASRPEFLIGQRFLANHREDAFWWFVLARWACIPFSLIGAVVCWIWASELYGQRAGVVALTLWCSCPNILGHGALITPDVGCAAFAIAAAYAFWKWLEAPTWHRAVAAGTVLGLAQLTKFTLVVFFGLWPALWLVCSLGKRRDVMPRGTGPRQVGLRDGAQLITILLLAVYLINLGYGFEGSFERLGDFGFLSRTIGGPCLDEGPHNSSPAIRNRFRSGPLANLPVPLPRNYVRGIDRQTWDFEVKKPSYLRGEWRTGGWWYYYVYALWIKVPLGTLLLVLMACGATLAKRGYASDWRAEWMLLAPLLAILGLVSSHTAFNHHLRYVLPIFPFGFIWISKVACSLQLGHRSLALAAAGALVWSVASSLWVYPHSLSYFNELVGGPRRGHYHLLNSNIDWGQDLFYLKRWLDGNPRARPLTLAHDVPLIDPAWAGIESTGLPPQHEPQPGWHALSVNRIQDRSGRYRYFLELEPVGMAGYSIYIYHVTPAQALRLRYTPAQPALRDVRG